MPTNNSRHWNLRQQPCPKGGPDHEPFPNGYLEAHEYAGHLLHTLKRTQSRCPACGLYGRWT